MTPEEMREVADYIQKQFAGPQPLGRVGKGAKMRSLALKLEVMARDIEKLNKKVKELDKRPCRCPTNNCPHSAQSHYTIDDVLYCDDCDES